MSGMPTGQGAPGDTLALGIVSELVHINEVDPDDGCYMEALDDLYWVG
jgi:hypothetical protein